MLNRMLCQFLDPGFKRQFPLPVSSNTCSWNSRLHTVRSPSHTESTCRYSSWHLQQNSQPSSTTICVNEPSWLSSPVELSDDSNPVYLTISISARNPKWEPTSGVQSAQWNIRDNCSFKPLCVGMICYTAIGN